MSFNIRRRTYSADSITIESAEYDKSELTGYVRYLAEPWTYSTTSVYNAELKSNYNTSASNSNNDGQIIYFEVDGSYSASNNTSTHNIYAYSDINYPGGPRGSFTLFDVYLYGPFIPVTLHLSNGSTLSGDYHRMESILSSAGLTGWNVRIYVFRNEVGGYNPDPKAVNSTYTGDDICTSKPTSVDGYDTDHHFSCHTTGLDSFTGIRLIWKFYTVIEVKNPDNKVVYTSTYNRNEPDMTVIFNNVEYTRHTEIIS